jgi:F0F1-type ATP synthase assembly protein I
MRLQDKFEEMKQKRDAQSYFRENNDSYLEPMDYLKALAVGMLVAIAGGFAIQFVAYTIEMYFLYAFLFVGFGVGAVIQKVTKTSNLKLALIALIAYVIGIAFGMVLYAGFEMGFDNVSSTMALIYFKSIFQDFVSLIFIIIGAVCAFVSAKK